jgi:hypothetical protein
MDNDEIFNDRRISEHRLETTMGKTGRLASSTCTGCDWVSYAGNEPGAKTAHKAHIRRLKTQLAKQRAKE